MKNQNYGNHIRYYTAHHFVFYPAVLIGITLSIRCIFIYPVNQAEWIAIAAVFMLIGWLSFMVRQHYGLINQNRTVRLELRLRYYILTHQRLEPIEAKLTPSQLYALRFACDEELPSLVNRTVAENLSPADIKKAVKRWEGDYMRV